MAKTSYRIPDTLDKNFMDTEIPLTKAAKPLPIGLVLLYVLSGLLWAWAVMRTFIGETGPVVIIPFTIVWVALSFLLIKRDKTDVSQYSLVVSMFDYLPKRRRRVYTRMNNKAQAFAGIVGIKDIDEKKGLLTFYDGTYGFAYRVVGTGSVLLFDEDRNAILDRCDTFFRKIQADVELIFITAKEPQKIYRQIDTMKRRYDAMTIRDADLDALADMNFQYLKTEVGQNFRSIHQYLILKADNREALTVAKNVLQSEVENSSLVFKQCTPLLGEEITQMLASIYRGKESV